MQLNIKDKNKFLFLFLFLFLLLLLSSQFLDSLFCWWFYPSPMSPPQEWGGGCCCGLVVVPRLSHCWCVQFPPPSPLGVGGEEETCGEEKISKVNDWWVGKTTFCCCCNCCCYCCCCCKRDGRIEWTQLMVVCTYLYSFVIISYYILLYDGGKQN